MHGEPSEKDLDLCTVHKCLPAAQSAAMIGGSSLRLLLLAPSVYKRELFPHTSSYMEPLVDRRLEHTGEMYVMFGGVVGRKLVTTRERDPYFGSFCMSNCNHPRAHWDGAAQLVPASFLGREDDCSMLVGVRERERRVVDLSALPEG